MNKNDTVDLYETELGETTTLRTCYPTRRNWCGLFILLWQLVICVYTALLLLLGSGTNGSIPMNQETRPTPMTRRVYSQSCVYDFFGVCARACVCVCVCVCVWWGGGRCSCLDRKRAV